MKCYSIDTLFNRLETDARRKKEEHIEKKVCSCGEGFRSHAYSTELLGHICNASEPKRKNREDGESHADRTNRQILEK